MKRKKKIIHIGFIALFIVLLILSSIVITNIRLNLVDVVVSSVNIPSNTLIEEEYLTTIQLPKDFISEDVYLSKEDVTSKIVLHDATIPKGSLIYKSLLQDEEDYYVLNENESCYDLFIKDVKCNPAVLENNSRINLYCTINKQTVLSDLLISNVKVLALYNHDYKEIKGNNKEDVSIISLALNSDFIPILNKAIIIGDLSLLISSDCYKNFDTELNVNSKLYEALK